MYRPSPSLRPSSRHLLPILLIVVCCCGLIACEPAPQGETGPVAISLVTAWPDVTVENAVPAPTPPPRYELTFGADGVDDGGGVRWSAVQGVQDLRVENGALVGRSTSETPILLLETDAPMGEGDRLWSVEARFRAAEGTRFGVHPLRDDMPQPAAVGRAEDWPLLKPMVAGDTMDLSIELSKVFLYEMPPATSAVQKILVRPTDAAGTDFALESLRLVFRGEHLAQIASGPGWHGLSEQYRESLVTRTPEALHFDVELPAHPSLFLATGILDQPARFVVEARAVDAEGNVDGDADVAWQTETTEAETWMPARIDLSALAGRTARLTLHAESLDGDDEPTLAFWGAPTVRNALPPVTADTTAAAAPAEGGAEPPRTVIVFLADTLRRDHLDAWGHQRETAPTVARLAREGVRFADAQSQATWTKVSVSSILTSLYPSTTGVVGHNDRIAAGETTLAEAFRDAGYATFATSSVPFTGQLTNLHQGVEVLYELGALRKVGDEGYDSKTSRFWIDRYLEWLELHRDVPTFAFIHVMDPHSPFRPEAPYDAQWAAADAAEQFEQMADTVRPHIARPLFQRFMAPTADELAAAGVDPESFVRIEKDWYDGSIRSMDAEIDRLLGQLDSWQLTAGTTLAFVADHGEEFLEHGMHWHGNSVYGELSNVPMLVWGHGVPAGRVVEQTVQTIDLYPTLLDLAGVEPPERAQGRSLVPLFAEGSTGRALPAFVEHRAQPGQQTQFALVDGTWRLVWNREPVAGRAEYELYDHVQDPLNQNDVAVEHPEEVERMARALDRWFDWATGQKLDEEAAQAAMSAEELEQLRSLGYVD